jgi:hypothetical protein
MEKAGKIMVLTTVAFSLVFCAYALAIYVQPINWGWAAKYKQKEFGKDVPSELEKRQAALKKLADEKERAVRAWTAASDTLAQTEAKIAYNQYWYAQQLERIQSGKDADVGKDPIKDLKYDAKGLVELDTPKDRTGKPVFDRVVAKKAYDSLVKDLNNLLTKIARVRDDIADIIKEEKNLTEELNGVIDAKGKQQKGLYALIDFERAVQNRAKEELEDLKPNYYQELVDSQLLLKRQASLKFRLNQLKVIGVAQK